jgi:hypothetical protein
MHSGLQTAPVIAAALTDAGLLLVVIAAAVAFLVFVLFALREALSRPVERPRELPPAHDLPPLADPDLTDPAAASAKRRPDPGTDRTP